MYASEAINKAFILKPQSAVFVYEDLESGARETLSSNPPTHPPPPLQRRFHEFKGQNSTNHNNTVFGG